MTGSRSRTWCWSRWRRETGHVWLGSQEKRARKAARPGRLLATQSSEATRQAESNPDGFAELLEMSVLRSSHFSFTPNQGSERLTHCYGGDNPWARCNGETNMPCLLLTSSSAACSLLTHVWSAPEPSYIFLHMGDPYLPSPVLLETR